MKRVPISSLKKGQAFWLYDGGALFVSRGETKYMGEEIFVLFDRQGCHEECPRAMPHGALVWTEKGN